MAALTLTMWLVAGLITGTAYFAGIWWSARQFGDGGHVITTIALSLLRLVLLGGVLALASFQGAGPLLAMALGVMLGRFAVMRRMREALP